MSARLNTPKSLRLKDRAWLEIDLKAVSGNLKAIRRLIGPVPKILAVVKTDAYTLGAAQIAKTAKAAGADFLGVGSPSEAKILEENDVSGPFLVLYPPHPDQILLLVERGYIQAITSKEMAEKISNEAVRQGKIAEVHFNINAGMNRLGIKWTEAAKIFPVIAKLPGLNFSGIFAQFSSAASIDKNRSIEEHGRFQTVKEQLGESGYKFPLAHMANSAAVLEFPQFAMDMVRTGILMYGVYPSQDVRREPRFQQAVSLKTQVIHTGSVKNGETVSYGGSWIAPSDVNLATVSIGTADGVAGQLSNTGEVLIRGKRYPIAGRICMDLTVISLGKDSVLIGDEVVFIGRQGEETIAVEDWVRRGNLDPHEILTGLGARLPKVYL